MNARRWRCAGCRWVGVDSEILTAPSPFDAADSISGCPRCKTVDKFVNVCDEPGCSREAGCGWPTPDGGYRRTCSEHMP